MTIPKSHDEHMRSAFARANISSDPFTHLVVHDVLPLSVYLEIQDRAPQPAACLSSTLRRFIKREKDISVPLDGPNWASYSAYLDLIDTLIIESFAAAIDTYMACLVSSGIAEQKPEIQTGQRLFCRRASRWSIRPHTHDIAQLVQTMIYLPVVGSSESDGTVLFHIKNDKEILASKLHATYTYNANDISEATTLPYKPNTLVSFINTPISIHGSKIASNGNRRYLFTCIEMQRNAIFRNNTTVVKLSSFRH